MAAANPPEATIVMTWGPYVTGQPRCLLCKVLHAHGARRHNAAAALHGRLCRTGASRRVRPRALVPDTRAPGQVYDYFRMFQKDPLYIKSLVGVLAAVTALQATMDYVSLYRSSVRFYGPRARPSSYAPLSARRRL